MEETIKRIQNGENNLLEGFIFENREYINSFINKYKFAIKDFEDLEQEVIKEFINAIYGYNFKFGFLKSYVRIKLYSCVNRYLIKNLKDFKDYDARYAFCVRIYELVKKRIGHEPSFNEFKKYLYINDNKATEIFNILNNPSIHDMRYEEQMSIIPFDEDKVYDKIKRDEIAKLINQTMLTKRQKELLLYHYGFYNGKSYNFSEMARSLNSDRQVYSRANETLLKRLKRRIVE